MKKIKLLAALMALILCASVVLTACGNKEDAIKIADIMNSEYAKEEKDGILDSQSRLSFAGNYKDADYGFVVTEEEKDSDTETEKNISTVRVYNVASGEAVASLSQKTTINGSTSTSQKHYVDIISEEYFAVLSVKTSTSSSSSSSGSTYVSNAFGCTVKFSDNVTNTLTICDANGDVVETFENEVLLSACSAASTAVDGVASFDAAYNNGVSSIAYEYQGNDYFAAQSKNDLFLIKNKLYRMDAEGGVELVKDFGLAKQPRYLTSMSKVGDSYLGIDESTLTLTVYDKELSEKYTYTIPEYIDMEEMEIACFALLANGSLLVQYAVQLDQNESSFDLRIGADGKYDLVTLLINEEKTTELKADYIIGDVDPSVEDEDGQKVYSDIVENLAFIYPIGDNKMADRTVANRQLVLLSNEGKVTDQVEIDGNISEEFPTHYLDDYYKVSLSDGSYALYDKEGELVSELAKEAMSATKLSGDYLLSNRVIYDINGETVKELKTLSHKLCGKSLVLTKAGLKSSTYTLFVDGETKSIGTTSETFSVVVSQDGYYYTVQTNKNGEKTTYSYTYYNEKGEKLVTTSYKLTPCTSTEDFVVFVGTEKVDVVDDTTATTKTKDVSRYYRFDVK